MPSSLSYRDSRNQSAAGLPVFLFSAIPSLAADMPAMSGDTTGDGFNGKWHMAKPQTRVETSLRRHLVATAFLGLVEHIVGPAHQLVGGFVRSGHGHPETGGQPVVFIVGGLGQFDAQKFG